MGNCYPKNQPAAPALNPQLRHIARGSQHSTLSPQHTRELLHSMRGVLHDPQTHPCAYRASTCDIFTRPHRVWPQCVHAQQNMWAHVNFKYWCRLSTHEHGSTAKQLATALHTIDAVTRTQQIIPRPTQQNAHNQPLRPSNAQHINAVTAAAMWLLRRPLLPAGSAASVVATVSIGWHAKLLLQVVLPAAAVLCWAMVWCSPVAACTRTSGSKRQQQRQAQRLDV
jgi:hypothetical protein